MLHRALAIASAGLALGGTAFRPQVTVAAPTTQIERIAAAVRHPGGKPSKPHRDILTAERAEDGMFYVTVPVNHVPVRFLVDTGANVVVLTREDAARTGVDPAQQSFGSHMQTANGASAMAWTTLDRISIGPRELRGVNAIVPERAPPVSLLGQNVLSKLGVMVMEGDSLYVRPGSTTS